MSMNDTDLPKNAANFAALTPVDFMRRAADVYPNRTAVIHGKIRRTWAQTYARSMQLAHALLGLGVQKGDTVTVMLANTPEMVECHFGVPVIGAMLNTLNTRLDAHSLVYMLDHAQSKVVIVDREFSRVVKEALQNATVKPIVIDVDDSEYDGPGERIGTYMYETLLANSSSAPIDFEGDEWDAMSLNYTSGTTGEPKGVVYHHRGAYLNAVSNILEWDLPSHPVYLWTLPTVSLQWLVLPLDNCRPRRCECLLAQGHTRGRIRRHR